MISHISKQILPFLLLLLLSCQKDVQIQVESSYSPELFIESILYPGEVPKVYLSSSQPFFSQRVTPQEIFVRDAQVQINTDTGIDQLKIDSTFDQFRCRWVPYYIGSTEVQRGKTYELLINHRGKSYEATTSLTQPKIEIEEVEYTPEFYDVYGDHDGVIVRFKDAPGEGNFYRFQMNRMIDNTRFHVHVLEVLGNQNNCTDGEKFHTVDLGRTIFSDENIDGQQLELYLEVSFEYLEGDTAYVMIQSLDTAAATFFNDLDHQLEVIRNPFVEPVFINSTIEGAFGVFGSAVRSDSILFIYPQDNP